MRGEHRPIRLAILLAAIAGFVDVVGYLALREVFVAHITGDTDLLGQQLARGDLAGALPLLTAVGTFVGSIALATGAVELASRRRWRSPAAAALLVEAALVAAFMVYGSDGGGLYALIALGAAAMGTQAARVVTWGSRTLRTTYVSGMMTRFAEHAVGVIAGPGGDGEPSFLRDRLGLGGRRDSARFAAVYLALWAGFLAGAALGGWAKGRFDLWALGFPLGGLALAIALDLLPPA